MPACLATQLRPRTVVALVMLCGTLTVCAGPADAVAATTPQVYWANDGNGTIGSANLDGTGVNQSFITGMHRPDGIAVNGQDIYWADTYNGSAGEATLSGTVLPFSLYPSANSVAVNDQHLFWGTYLNPTMVQNSGLDGSGLANFASAPGTANGIAVNGQYVYWTNSYSGTIGRANLNGTGVNQNFITGVTSGATGLAVDNQYIYWANTNNNSIGRANLNSTGVNQSFISTTSGPLGLAVDSQYIYWSNNSGAIGRANLNGTGINESFIQGASQPMGIALSVPVLNASTPTAFAQTHTGSTSSQTLTITNGGQQSLTISRLSLTGANPGDFAVSAGTCSTAVAPGAKCQITVSFSPRAQGTLDASLQITSNDFANSPRLIPFTGTGTPPVVKHTRIKLTICHAVIHHDNDGDQDTATEGLTKTRKCVSRHVKVVTFKLGKDTRATLRRAGHIYATGTVRRRNGHVHVILNRRRPIRRGYYKLIVRTTVSGHRITQRRGLRIR